MIYFNAEIERAKVADYIFQTWDASKHNFSINEDGDYAYQTMQIAWEAWRFAKKECINDLIKADVIKTFDKPKVVKNG